MKTKNGGGSGYTHKIQNNPKLAIMKVMEEAEELSLAENRKRKV
jgi:phosphoribosyl-ATP pyrophosphohydrolase